MIHAIYRDETQDETQADETIEFRAQCGELVKGAHLLTAAELLMLADADSFSVCPKCNEVLTRPASAYPKMADDDFFSTALG